MVGKNIQEHVASSDYEILAPTSNDLDLLVPESVSGFIGEHSPDFVIHAAGHVGGIQANIKDPQEFLLKNLNMSQNVISSSNDAGVKRLLNLGSSCMYPRDGVNPLKEESILNGHLEPTNEGYALAKIVSAKLCEYISEARPDRNYKTIIPCNLFGRHDKYDPVFSHMIPSVMRRLYEAKLNGQNIVRIWGDGSARREFMSASELADFIFYAINNFEKMPQTLNVGIGQDFSIQDYYKMIASVVGYKGKFEYDLTKPVGMKQKLVDNSRQVEFGWTSKRSISESLIEAFTFLKGEHKL